MGIKECHSYNIEHINAFKDANRFIRQSFIASVGKFGYHRYFMAAILFLGINNVEILLNI